MNAIFFALFACGGGADTPLDTEPVVGPTQPSPPPGLSHEGDTLFSLDVAAREVGAETRGAPEGVALLGVLADQGGRRALVVREGDRAVEVAPPGWHLPPVGAWRGEEALICWNTLTGPESAPGAMPHPSGGLSLQCRQGGRSLGPAVSFDAGGAPAWLVDVQVEGDGWLVTAYHNAAGWLLGEVRDGDGLRARTFVDGAFGPATPVAPTQD